MNQTLKDNQWLIWLALAGVAVYAMLELLKKTVDAATLPNQETLNTESGL